MTYYWVDAQGNIGQATSEIPNPLPEKLEGLTPLNSDEYGAPDSGRQKWDGSKWLPLDPVDIPPTQADIIDALLEATIVSLPGAEGDKLRDIKQRLRR